MKVTKNNLKDFAKVILSLQEDLKRNDISLTEKLLDKIVVSYEASLNELNTSKSIFRFPKLQSEEALEADPIVWFFTEEMIQSEAEEEIDRRLTDVELHRVFQCFFEDDDTLWNRLTFVREAIRNATDEPEQWSELDKDFLEEKIAEKEVISDDKLKKVCN